MKGMLVEEPARVVLACVMWEEVRRGIRNWEDQPAPRIRNWTGAGRSIGCGRVDG